MVSTEEKMTQLVCQFIGEKLGAENYFLGLASSDFLLPEHDPRDAQVLVDSGIVSVIGDRIEAYFDQYISDSEAIAWCFIRESVGYINWYYIVCKMNNIISPDFTFLEDNPYEGFANSLTFTLWYAISNNEGTLNVLRECSGEALVFQFKEWIRSWFSGIRTCSDVEYREDIIPLFQEIVIKGIHLVNWQEVAENISLD
jgi:hypothetical protein